MAPTAFISEAESVPARERAEIARALVRLVGERGFRRTWIEEVLAASGVDAGEEGGGASRRPRTEGSAAMVDRRFGGFAPSASPGPARMQVSPGLEVVA